MLAAIHTPNVQPLHPSALRPSRQAVFFNTLEVPKVTISTDASIPTTFLDDLQQSLIRATRNTKLFTQVMPDAPYEPGGGGVLSVRGTILNWAEDDRTAWVKIHVALIAKGIGDQFAESTAAGTIKRSNAIGGGDTASGGVYDISPLVEGISTFISTFMDPI